MFKDTENKSGAYRNTDAINEMITGKRQTTNTEYGDLSLDMSDEEVIAACKRFQTASKPQRDRTNDVMERGLQYLTGFHIDDDGNEYTSPENLIGFLTDTLISYSTASTPDFDVLAYDSSDDAQKYADLCQLYLKAIHQRNDIKGISQKACYDGVSARHGYFEVIRKNGKTKLVHVPVMKLYLDPDATDYGMYGDANYYGVIMDNYTIKDLMRAYPKKAKELEAKYGKDSKDLFKKATAVRWMTKEYIAIVLEEEIVLKLTKNNTVNYTDSKKEESVYGDFTKVSQTYNLVDSPFLPLLSISFGNFGKLGSGTNPIEQAYPLQDGLDDTNFTIAYNRKKVGYATLVGQGISKEDMSLIDQRDVEDSIAINQGEQLDYIVYPAIPAYMIEERDRIKQSMYDITGIHPISFGKKDGNATLGERKILKEGDENRMATLAGNLERKLGEAGLMILQFEKVYATEEDVIPVLGESGGTDFVKMHPKFLKYGLAITVKPGSLFPKDERGMADTMMELFKNKALSIGSLLKSYKIDDPDNEVNKIIFEQLLGKVNEAKVMEYANAFHEMGIPYTTELLVKAITGEGFEDEPDQKALVDKVNAQIDQNKQAQSQTGGEVPGQIPPEQPKGEQPLPQV